MITPVYPWNCVDTRGYADTTSANVDEQGVIAEGGTRVYRDEALAALAWHWGEAYEVTEALGVWRAVRLDNWRALVATEAEDLRDQIVDDYTRAPVPRGTRT
jgi:hypothetical protein